MKTTCHICGKTGEESGLIEWGKDTDYGWYHLACAQTKRLRIEEMLSEWRDFKTSAYWRLESERARLLVMEKGKC